MELWDQEVCPHLVGLRLLNRYTLVLIKYLVCLGGVILLYTVTLPAVCSGFRSIQMAVLMLRRSVLRP